MRNAPWRCARRLAAWWIGAALAMALAPVAMAAAPPPATPASGRTATERLRSADLLADVDVLQQAYETLHPGLHRYNTPAQVQAHFDALRGEFARDRTLADAFVALSRFTAAIRCGHTYPNFYNQTRAVQQALFEGQDKLPAQFRWIDDDAMLVTRDLTAEGALPVGSRIVAVDGVPAGEMLRALLPLVRADGGNDAKRRALLEVQGEDGYETFDVYRALLYPKADAVFALEVLAPGARQTRRVRVPALTFAQRQAGRRAKDDRDDRGWRFGIDADGIATLAMPDWALYDSRWNWQGFVADAFAQVHARDARALVLDLRGNEGGIDVGDAILPHLVAQPLAIRTPPPLVRYRKVPDALVPVLDTWDPSFRDWGDKAVAHDARFLRLVRDADDIADAGPGRVVQPRAPRFAGPVFVLVGASNSSATFQFAEQVQQAGIARLVGQPTGGNRRGINGGAFFFLRLPRSGLEVDLPLIARFRPGEPDAGLVPDIAVQPTAADVAAGRDAEMAAVRVALAAARAGLAPQAAPGPAEPATAEPATAAR